MTLPADLAALPSPTPQPLPTQVRTLAPTQPPATATPGPSPTPPPAPIDQYLPGRKQVGETQHFIFYEVNAYQPVELTWWMQQAETLYGYVSQRLQAQAKNKIPLGILPPEQRACPVRGLTIPTDHALIVVYADAQSPRPYLQAVLAHEIGHAIAAEGYPGGVPDEISLSEGLATWGAEKYWDAWKNVPSLDALIRDYIQQGVYEPLTSNYDLHGIYPWQSNIGPTESCLARRDKVYSEWADFLGYLIQQYGWDKAHQLFRLPKPAAEAGQTILYPPAYQQIYGKTLNQLEYEWLVYLQSQH